MTIKHLFGTLALTVALAACGKSGGGADIEAFIKLDSAKAAAFTVGGEDCEAKAKSVGEWRTQHTADYQAMQKKLKEKWPKGPPDAVKDKYGDQLKANKQAVMGAMVACSGNATFSKMIDDTEPSK